MDPIRQPKGERNEHADIVCKDISERMRPVRKTEKFHTGRIIKRFFEYAFLSSIHGYKISKAVSGGINKFVFSFYFIQVKKIPKGCEHRIRFSPKAIGYYFISDINIPGIKSQGFRVKLSKKLMKQAIAITESNKVYDLINPKK